MTYMHEDAVCCTLLGGHLLKICFDCEFCFLFLDSYGHSLAMSSKVISRIQYFKKESCKCRFPASVDDSSFRLITSSQWC